MSLWESISTHFKIYLLLLLIGSFIGLLIYRSLNFQLRWTTLLLVFTFVSESIGRVLAYLIKNSNPAYHFYTPIEGLCLGFILYGITNNLITRRVITTVFLSVILFSILNSFVFQSLYEFNSNADIAKMPLAILVSFMVLFESINSQEKKYLLSSDLILVVGIIWFNVSSFVFIAAHDYLIKSGISTRSLGNIHYFSNIIYYSLLTASLVVFKKEINAVPKR